MEHAAWACERDPRDPPCQSARLTGTERDIADQLRSGSAAVLPAPVFTHKPSPRWRWNSASRRGSAARTFPRADRAHALSDRSARTGADSVGPLRGSGRAAARHVRMLLAVELSAQERRATAKIGMKITKTRRQATANASGLPMVNGP